jgi:hypothetical protein
MATERTKAKSEIDELRSRYDKLREKRLLAQNNLDNANRQLQELKKQAQEQWGTDDLEQLGSKLAQMRKENEQRVAAYRAHLDTIEQELNQVEKKHSGQAEE